MRTSGPNLDYSRAQSSCLDAHTSFETNTAAANVYKENDPHQRLGCHRGDAQKQALKQASQGPRAVPCYSIQDCEFSLVLPFHWLIRMMLKPGGVLNILDLTSIITSKGAMVLCARVALMVCGSFLSESAYSLEISSALSVSRRQTSPIIVMK
ncbi:hypothetical protein B0H14DRAFT_3136327 [Mycena olivaceomarginata]|nr:hypothetical protein B0H14DRAFT_3136327 [Mycena olivaceomarginata]